MRALLLLLLGALLCVAVQAGGTTSAVKVKVPKRRQPVVVDTEAAEDAEDKADTEGVESPPAKRLSTHKHIELAESVDEREKKQEKRQKKKKKSGNAVGLKNKARTKKYAPRMTLWYLLKSFFLALVDPTVGGAVEVVESSR
jgi:hypothetical protein